ncbi:MAG: low molecular weight phosphatase family protein [Pseudomonadota bacterium]
MAHSVLFACNMNSVRSPMAAALMRRLAGDRMIVDSAGVYKGDLDPFVEIVMRELDINMRDHEPKAMTTADLSGFDLVIALTEEAEDAALQYVPREKVELWVTENPSDERGDQEAVVGAYRRVRDAIAERLSARFPEFHRNA